MSEHDIADCPKCGKRDFVLREDGVWVCLKCDYTKKMPTTPESSPVTDLSAVIFATIIALAIAFSVLGI